MKNNKIPLIVGIAIVGLILYNNNVELFSINSSVPTTYKTQNYKFSGNCNKFISNVLRLSDSEINFPLVWRYSSKQNRIIYSMADLYDKKGIAKACQIKYAVEKYYKKNSKYGCEDSYISSKILNGNYDMPSDWKYSKTTSRCVQSLDNIYTKTGKITGCKITYFDGKCTCSPKWHCSEWSNCIDGKQTRNCIDLNECGINTGKPTTSQSCTVSCTPSICSNECQLFYGNGDINNLNLYVLPIVKDENALQFRPIFEEFYLKELKNQLQTIYPFSNALNKINVYAIWKTNLKYKLLSSETEVGSRYYSGSTIEYLEKTCKNYNKDTDVYLNIWLDEWDFGRAGAITDAECLNEDLTEPTKYNCYQIVNFKGPHFAHELMHVCGVYDEDYGSNPIMWNEQNTKKVLNFLTNNPNIKKSYIQYAYYVYLDTMLECAMFYSSTKPEGKYFITIKECEDYGKTVPKLPVGVPIYNEVGDWTLYCYDPLCHLMTLSGPKGYTPTCEQIEGASYKDLSVKCEAKYE